MKNKILTRREFGKITALSALAWNITPAWADIGPGTKRIRIAQIGTSHSHAEEKYQTLTKLSDVFDVIGIVEPNPDYLKKAKPKEEFQDAKWITEEQLMDTKGLQAVLVETDFKELLPIALKFAKKGLHVHIDKPPGTSLADLKKLYKIAKNQNLIVQMGYMFRYNPAFKFCIDAVKNGLLGNIYQVDGVISKKIKSSRRTKLAASYGGSMMLLGCHLIDMLAAVCGKPQEIHSYRKQTYKDNDGLYDNELAVFNYPQTTATIRSSLLEVGGKERRQFVIAGEHGTIEINPLEPPKLRFVLDKSTDKYSAGRHHIELPQMPGRYDEQLTDFAKQINGEKISDFSAEHDIIVHEAVLTACEMN